MIGFVNLTPNPDMPVSDWSHTAAVIADLDLVISVDTAVAHLAGAMGKPVWVMLAKGSDWRWMLKRDDSPWYPSMRLFRQTRLDDWSEVLASVAEAFSARYEHLASEKSEGETFVSPGYVIGEFAGAAK